MISVQRVDVQSYIHETALEAADYTINPYIGCCHGCLYCYAQFMRDFTRHKEEWGSFLDVKQCSSPIPLDKIAGKRVVIGTATDPYNPYEKEYEATRNILKQLAPCCADITIVTKSDLILRDLDLLRTFSNLTAAISLVTLDDAFRQKIEPHAPSVQRRVHAVESLHASGIKTVLFCAPVFPYLTVPTELMDALRDVADEFWFDSLHMKSPYQERVLRLICTNYPQFYAQYRTIYQYHNSTYWLRLEETLEHYRIEHAMNGRIIFHSH